MPNKRIIEIAQVEHNKEVAPDIYLLTLQSPHIAKAAQPGQFVNFSMMTGASANLLKRPFSIHNVSGKSLQLLYRIKGEGTQAMTLLRKGDAVELLGPLGTAFTLCKDKTVLLVGGGIGIAPLIYTESMLRKHNKTLLLYGVKTKADAVTFKGAPVHLHEDDQEKTFVCEGLDQRLKDWKITDIKTCGPTPMMKEIVAIAKKLKIPVEVSMESHMACGFGVCLGCVVQTKKEGYRKVCSDGPVFDGNDIW